MIQCIAHRGASDQAPENTFAAFNKAVDLGATSLECDIALTKEGVPIIIHDSRLERTTNGTGPVSSLTLEEIKVLDAGSWYSEEFAQQRVPTLAELLQWQQNKDLCLHLEIKPLRRTRLSEDLDRILAVLAPFERKAPMKILSFQKKLLERLHQLNSQLPRVYSVSNPLKEDLQHALALRCCQINFSSRYLNKKRLEQIQKLGLSTGVFTINTMQELEFLEELGVNQVYTDNSNLLTFKSMS